jgi:hypothetical protein
MAYIEEDRTNKVFKSLRSTLTYARFMQAYVNYIPKFDKAILDGVELPQLEQFAKVFHFKKNTVDSMRAELCTYLKSFWRYFGGESYIEVGTKMFDYLTAWNAQRKENGEDERPYINWIPLCGGVLKVTGPKDRDELQFMAANGIKCELTGRVPLVSEEEKDWTNVKSDELSFT